MSQQGLDEVIAELKNRGIKAGEEEREKIVAAAQTKARQIVAEANEEAQRVRDKAKNDAEATRTQLAAELRQASAVGLEAFRQAVERAMLVPELDSKMAEVLGRPEFLKEILVEAARGFTQSGGAVEELDLLLPEAQRGKLEGGFLQALRKESGVGVTVQFDEDFSFGFKMAPSGGGYLFDFTEDGFREILLRFLAPRFRKYFFKEE
ncbi:MAG: hypothetical protein JW797_01490 [Bradymonadales bacterium]|nr:hypothetical protein [Bradymonadales bacterium]